MINVTVRCTLRDRRKAQGLSIRQLEAISGITRGNLSQFENNRKLPAIETAAKLAVILNCTLDDLFEIKRM
ncbi:helix-turn-helix domain-containing protein [Heyndrickxia oleronia]|uniref:Helix-turn-helix transcriptional regulator n=1 Tax=Heyndrickxia oleronia TaxID=38875 RepID=A0AAW6SRH8_9BACI|nr:helix-turn-helix transcriptional regulator [Heyndrickxia oleronia]MDH5159872.1 helix-turn-helix transcriptional regulator [Heyndrickxia oleronia]